MILVVEVEQIIILQCLSFIRIRYRKVTLGPVNRSKSASAEGEYRSRARRAASMELRAYPMIQPELRMESYVDCGQRDSELRSLSAVAVLPSTVMYGEVRRRHATRWRPAL